MNPPRPTDRRAPARPRVLLVDDDPAQLATLAALLGEDAEVACATDGAAALARLAEAPADVVVADLRMPGVSGLDLLRAVARAHPATLGMIVTGEGGSPDARAARADPDVALVVVKPYEPLAMRAWVRSLATLAGVRRSTLRLRAQKPPPR